MYTLKPLTKKDLLEENKPQAPEGRVDNDVRRWLPANGKVLSPDAKQMICLVEFKGQSWNSLPDKVINKIADIMNEHENA